MARVPLYGPLGISDEDSLVLLLEELDELHIAHLRQLFFFCGAPLRGTHILIELGLAAGEEVEVIPISVLGQSDNGYFWELFEEVAMLFGGVEVFGADQVQLQVFFEEEGDGEEVEIAGSEKSRYHHDADLGHVDR